MDFIFGFADIPTLIMWFGVCCILIGMTIAGVVAYLTAPLWDEDPTPPEPKAAPDPSEAVLFLFEITNTPMSMRSVSYNKNT